jgi:hypothetical protein
MIRTKTERTEISQQLINLVDVLSFEKAQQLLEFATFLQQQSEAHVQPPIAENLDEWEIAIQQAEAYWFSLPESVRQLYAGKSVAIVQNQIVDSDPQLRSLKQRVRQRFPLQPVLYIEADTTELPSLIIRSPRLR